MNILIDMDIIRIILNSISTYYKSIMQPQERDRGRRLVCWVPADEALQVQPSRSHSVGTAGRFLSFPHNSRDDRDDRARCHHQLSTPQQSDDDDDEKWHPPNCCWPFCCVLDFCVGENYAYL